MGKKRLNLELLKNKPLHEMAHPSPNEFIEYYLKLNLNALSLLSSPLSSLLSSLPQALFKIFSLAHSLQLFLKQNAQSHIDPLS